MLRKFLLLSALLTSLCPVVTAAEKVYYPRPESASDPRTEYPVKLLELAIQKSGAQYELLPSELTMPQGRAITEVGSNAGNVHIVWTMTSKDREQKLLPIRIPIYKGLIGWRLPLVTKGKANQFKDIKSLADMKPFQAGQGHDWPDTEIIRANGLTVFGAPNYEGLFKMLENGRFGYFPRSVAEIWPEAEAHASQGIVVDNHIALHYPAAFYYFVNNNNKKLADALNAGLEKAIADGTFEKLFQQYYEPIIKRSGLDKRVIIELKNPLLPPETPLQRKELWFRPQ